MNSNELEDSYSLIYCRECGVQCKQVAGKHLANHGMTADDYRTKYPNAPLICQESGDKRSKNITKALTGKPAHNKGKPMSEEQKKKLSEAKKGKATRTGAVLSEETKQKISKSLTGRSLTVNHRQSLSDAIARKKENGTYVHPLSNYVMTEEHRQKSTAALIAANERKSIERMAILRDSLKDINLTFIEAHGKMWTVRCDKCSTVMTYMRGMFRKRRRYDKSCPTCYPRLKGSSKEEVELFEDVREAYAGEIIQNTYLPIKGFEVDMHLTELNLGVEYNGLYWHSCNRQNNTRHDNHLSHKTKYGCKEGIDLIQVFSDEFINFKNVVLSRIKNFLPTSDLLSVGDDAYVKEIDGSKLDKFIEKYSMTPVEFFGNSFGIFCDDNLVAVVSSTVEDGTMTITDIAVHPKYETKDLIGILTNYVKSFLGDISEIVVLLDMRWQEAKLFKIKEHGYVYQSITEPVMWVTDYHNRFDIASFDNKSEEEISELGYDWIYDCGYSVWKLTLY